MDLHHVPFSVTLRREDYTKWVAYPLFGCRSIDQARDMLVFGSICRVGA